MQESKSPYASRGVEGMAILNPGMCVAVASKLCE